MHPILFRLGPYIGYTYTAALVAGMLSAVWAAYREARRRGIDPVAVLDGAFWATLCGVLGARAGYVLANGTYFAAHIAEAFDLRAGGLSWHGALVGGTLGTAVWYLVRQRSARRLPGAHVLCDCVAPGLALCAAWAWLGCLLAGAGYGLAAEGTARAADWLAAELPDIYGVREMRYLTQPLMIAWSLLLWGLLQVRASPVRRLPPGTLLPTALALYAGGDLGVWFLRGDGVWHNGLWLGAWADLAVAGASAAIGIWVWLRGARHPPRETMTVG
jgi:prolipoprotein diacylglyceryltransferase